jgi:hypothetical protein
MIRDGSSRVLALFGPRCGTLASQALVVAVRLPPVASHARRDLSSAARYIKVATA